ncbi:MULTISPECIES: Uma2 family endonuclease [unclassified Aureimonas]|uniref:Uma2 family endonuclease n=1 Tax=unclassified Aureimonas TaxID=2615206 RepID=UPI0006F2736B|nr:MULTISPECIES: Uma2 family endonuclease [unclassified Aureimonas]KQT52560.1 hypothetical protein ASG62_15255 [Aureimonas sp. Leaf427]KQT77539.1 hypothetical protein ASG54_11155 [Aureimonas sp. Leaf460]
MNIQTPGIALRTADDFLAWNEGREGRREFVDGRIVEMMTGVSKNHNRVATNLLLLLGSRLDRHRYDIGTADYAVRTKAGVRYPDLYIEEKGTDGAALSTEAPILVAEILSPSSLAIDFGPKVTEYISIPSLRIYLVLSQDEPRAWIWNREENGFVGPDILFGINEQITLGAFDLRVPLADLYHDVA